MDISKITDIKELKALAFDGIVLLEQTQRSLQALNNRIAEVQSEVKPPSK